MPNQAINDSFHESCDDYCSSDADDKNRYKNLNDSDGSPEGMSPAAPVTNLMEVNGLMKGKTMRAKRAMEKMNPQEDNKDEMRIKDKTEEQRKINIDKCMKGKDHAHDGDDDDNYHGDRKSKCETCKELVIMCLMDILLFLFLCT